MSLGNSLTRSLNGEYPAKPATILLVDDDPRSLESMAAMLDALGEQVLTATSAEQALKHLLKHEIAVIVLDVVMPGIDGFKLASMIRERERFRHTPIIFLSGLYKEDNQMLRGYRTGAVDYLLKPCDPEVFRYKVKTFVDLAKQSEMLKHYYATMEEKNRELEENGRKLQDALSYITRAHEQLQREVEQRRLAETHRDQLASKLGARPDFIEAMADGAVTLALDQTILYCNNRLAAMLNRPLSEIVGCAMVSLVEESSHEAFATLFLDALAGSAKAELNLVGGNGELVPVQVAMSRFSGPDLEAMAIVVTDLRDYKRNQELLAQGRLARHILQQSSSGIAVCDMAGRITLPSAALAEIGRCDPLFKHFDEVFSLVLAGDRRFSVHDVLAGTTYRSEEAALSCADGRKFTVLLSAGPVNANGDATVGCVITLVDISERERVEEALRRSEKLIAAGRVAAALAHEVNNPLTAVMNLLFLAQNSPSLDDETREWVNSACQETERVSHIVRKALAFYRDTTKPVPVDLCEVLDNVLELFATTIAGNELQVERRYRYKGTIVGYPGELRQVFTNLVSNAVEACGPKGRLYLDIFPSGRRDMRGVRIVVADNGKGIATEHLSSLFEPFFTTKGENGTGLGLWVTQGIVEKLGGFIRVRSRADRGRSGTVFSVFLPLAEMHAEAAAQGGGSSAGQKQGAGDERAA